jgi:hypothetical protein
VQALSSDEPVSPACTNCGAGLSGTYCARCGQRRFTEADRRFGHLVREFLAAATDLDGRFWGSVLALLFRPGRLSRDYMNGRRARWMSPIALFLLANVTYFVFVHEESDLATSFDWEVPGRIELLARDPGTIDAQTAERLHADPGPAHSRFTAPLVERRVRARDAAARAASNGERGYDFRDYRRAYDARVPEASKALVVVHVPFLALALMVTFRRRGRYYAEHFVVALHLLAFNMATIVAANHGLGLLHLFAAPADAHYAAVNWILRAVMTCYVVVALRRVYDVRWAWSIAATAAVFAAYVAVNVYVYRPVLFLTVFAIT